jgi:hypothetical protein
MEQSPSWTAKRSGATQEIFHILWNPMVHCRIHKSLPPVFILRRIDPSHFSKIRFNIILPPTPGWNKYNNDDDNTNNVGSRHSVVTVVTKLDDLEFGLRQKQYFFSSTNVRTQPATQWELQTISVEVKWPKHEAGYSGLSNADVRLRISEATLLLPLYSFLLQTLTNRWSEPDISRLNTYTFCATPVCSLMINKIHLIWLSYRIRFSFQKYQLHIQQLSTHKIFPTVPTALPVAFSDCCKESAGVWLHTARRSGKRTGILMTKHWKYHDVIIWWRQLPPAFLFL